MTFEQYGRYAGHGSSLDDFPAEYADDLRQAYPRRPDGSTLVPSPRFVVAEV